MSKQVITAVAQDDHQQQQSKNLYVTVTTYDEKGKQSGVRVVDMYHYGTRNWMANHLWWATHNGQAVEVNLATQTEVDEYMAQQTKALAAKFNGVEAVKEPVAA